MRAMRTALRGGLAGRRLQALIIGVVVLVSAAASTLAAGLLVAPADLDHSIARGSLGVLGLLAFPRFTELFRIHSTRRSSFTLATGRLAVSLASTFASAGR